MKTGVAALSVCSNLFLVSAKLVIGFVTGSVSILAEGIHSGMDLAAAVIAFAAVRVSDRPPDERHAYGHGKYENISGTAEALLIIAAAVYIGYEAVMKFIHGGELSRLDVGMGIMFVSAVLNWIVSGRLFRVAKETDSIALEADGQHLRLDVYTSLGVLVGLFIVYLTHLVIIDRLLALAVALWIGWVGIRISGKALGPLLDTQLPLDEVERIVAIIDSDERIRAHHKLRTRKSGAHRHVDVHLLVPPDMSLADAHNLAEDVEDLIRAEFDHTTVVTHVEPEGDER
ncbi:MAG: cation diffusion facilitator family transporter [Armatimonadetes bacterium]|nr:cation diffusion facilitator family transporter [Armatimonadota bacterium]